MGVANESIGSGTGAFSSSITGLTPGTQYYVASYATNSQGTAYGSVLTFSTAANAAPVVSITSVSPVPPTSTQAVTVITDVTDSNGDALTVNLNWGTSSASLSNTISMTNTGGDTYSAAIPAQTSGTTVFYNVAANDSFTTTTSTTRNYTVQTSGLQVAAADTLYTIDFDNTVAGINNGAFTGTGIAPAPTVGQLNSGGIRITGFSDGDSSFGDTKTTGDFARGTSTGVASAGTGGLYAFNVANGGTANRALGIKPSGNDFTPGTVSLRLVNRTGAPITEISVSYEVLTYRTQARNNSLDFARGSDVDNLSRVTDLKFESSTTSFGTLKWRKNLFETTRTGLNIPNGASYFISWTGDDNMGSGDRPQIAIDNIKIVANPTSYVTSASGNYESLTVDGEVTALAGTNIEGFINVPGGTLNANGNLTLKSTATRSAIVKTFADYCRWRNS